MARFSRGCAVVAVVAFIASTGFAAESYTSHAPTRPLPQPSQRPLGDGPHKFVDAKHGDDANPGTPAQPWRTLGFAVAKLQPGDTLCLRGGTYHEHVAATLVGTADKPITIRAYPGELVTLDGGLPEFLHEPATAWEPCPDGVAGEFRSTRTYPGIEVTGGDLQVSLLGNFADSLLPLHGYWHHPDLQSDNPYWTLGGGEKVQPDAHVYCGPGLWYDPDTDRIHCRLAHTKLPGLGDDNYTGEIDPRKVPLVVAGWGHGPVLKLEDCRHVRLQDLVLRGARQHTLDVRSGSHLELEGLTLYGGQSCLMAVEVNGLRMAHTACRGLAAPWTFRGSLKYRSIESRIVRTGGWDPTGADGRNYEFAYCEFTDSVDGVFIGNIHTVYFHHNLVENVSDDAIFVTSPTGYDGVTPGGNFFIFQNRFARNLTCFSFGVGHGRQKTIADGPRGSLIEKQIGDGLLIYRNVFDFRRPVMYRWPAGPDDVQEMDSFGRFAGDHGSPVWEGMKIYHNTLITGDPPRYEYGTDGFTRAMGGGTERVIFNNIVCQLHGLPGTTFPPGDVGYFAGFNLLWSASDGPHLVASTTGPLTPAALLPKAKYPQDQKPPRPNWGSGDIFNDPKFVAFDTDWRKPVDLQLQKESPAVDAGIDMRIETKATVFDAFDENHDADRPDIGAIPLGVPVWRVGCGGRLDVCGNSQNTVDVETLAFEWNIPEDSTSPLSAESMNKPAVIVCGYPAFEAPLVEYALRKQGVKVDVLEKTWLDPREYSRYSTVVVDGSLLRAKMTVDHYAPDELPVVRRFLEDGGALWLCRERHDLFSDPAGREFLASLGVSKSQKPAGNYQVTRPEHPWVKHLAGRTDFPWLQKNTLPLFVKQGEVVLGVSSGTAALLQVPVGKGKLVYLGWSPAASLPNGREQITVADEATFAEQMQIVLNIAESLYLLQAR